MTVGILALQGDFREHEEILRGIGVPTLQVRLPQHLDAVDRLILPGGESTTIGKLLMRFGLLEPLRQRAQEGMPLWGTCAGTILLARTIHDGLPDQVNLNIMDIDVRRNTYGRQKESFETALHISALGAQPVRAVFIRAPGIESTATSVDVLAHLPENPQAIVAARQGHLLATTFHPELTGDERFHRYFLDI
jgi:5'-phosphate synthase pdxT subunit